MASSWLSCAVRSLLRRCARGDITTRGDEQLLEQFAKHRDEEAFAAMVARHGPMVLEVCRRALFDPAAAEDAFQATFLVLIRKAGSIRKGELLGGWLHGVASRIAARARVEAARRKARESASTAAAQPTDPLTDVTMRECLAALDEEITRLPARHRAPLVLCYLEGRTRDDAAHELGYSLATLDRRLKESRERLRGRLAARGVTMSGALLAAALGEQAGRAAVPIPLAASTVKLAAGTAAGARVTVLTEGVLKTMLLTKLKAATAVVGVLGFVATAMTVLACRTAAGQGDKPPTAAKAVKTPEKPEPVGRAAPRKKTEAAKGLKLTLSADRAETRMDPASLCGAVPVKLKLTFTNTGNKPIKLDASYLPYRIKFHCDGPGPDSIKKVVVLIDALAKPPTEKDYPVLQPGKSWSPSWTPSFPGDMPEGVGAGAVYYVRQPGTYKLRMTVYDKYAPHVEGAAPGITLVESNVLELKVREKAPLKVREKAPSGKKAVNERFRVRVFRGYEKGPAGQWQLIYLDQVVPLGTSFDVRDKSDRTAAKGVLQRTSSGRLHFKGHISAFHCNAAAVDAPVELGKPIKAKGGLGGTYLVEDYGIPKYAIFVCIERPKPERPGNVKVIKKASAIQEKVGGVFPKRADVLVVPGPRPQKQALSQWFQSRLKADNVLTADQETWVLFRSQQVSDYDRMSIERIEQQGDIFIVTMNYTPYLGPLYRNGTYHEVHGLNLGKLPAGDYTVQWMIGSFRWDGRTKELKSADGWQELKRNFNVRPGRVEPVPGRLP